MFLLAAVSALMPFAMTAFPVAVPFSVVAALDIRIICKISRDKSFYRFIGIPRSAAVKRDPCICKGILRSHSDPAADQGVHSQFSQKTCQRPVSASVGICDLLFCDLPVFHVVDLKLLCVSEMLTLASPDTLPHLFRQKRIAEPSHSR